MGHQKYGLFDHFSAWHALGSNREGNGVGTGGGSVGRDLHAHRNPAGIRGLHDHINVRHNPGTVHSRHIEQILLAAFRGIHDLQAIHVFNLALPDHAANRPPVTHHINPEGSARE